MFYFNFFNGISPHNGAKFRFHNELNLWVGFCLLNGIFKGLKLVELMHNGYFAGMFGQSYRLFQGRIAPTHNYNLFSIEEIAIASGAIRYSTAFKFLLTWNTQHSWSSSGC